VKPLGTPLRAVLFDLWGTLIVDDPSASELRHRLRIQRAQDTLAALGFDFCVEDIETGFAAAGVQHSLLHEQERDLSRRGRTILYAQQLDEALPGQLDDEAWAQLDEAILTPALHHGPGAMLGAREALASVKMRGLSAGLISNTGITPGTVLRQILDEMNMLEILDVVVFSDEVEVAKPAASIFLHTLEQLGVEAAEAAFVGDQPHLDVLGSRRAGMWSVQIGDVVQEGMPAPHARISSMAELIAALDALGPSTVTPATDAQIA
jgi:putative hydrolase of the HAD superfamily